MDERREARRLIRVPRLRAFRNRQFSSALRRDPSEPVAVLSPHLDDAVIDCWSVITRPGGALGRAGRTPTNPGFLGFSYRDARAEPSFGHLDRALVSRIRAVSALYAPAALGSVHLHHDLVRAYALAMAAQGFPVTLYADLPYCVGPWMAVLGHGHSS